MRILVTGQNSYAGSQFAKRTVELNKEWEIDCISMRDNNWKLKDFSVYDAIYHVAGIVHKKETDKNRDLYYEVNRDLTYQLALKAKREGVQSFIFLSTMAIYGLIGKIGEETVISKETKPVPNSNYGKSKLEAEELLKELQSSNFDVSILRIPIIYGPNCPGNYSSLSKLARNIHFFPNIDNRRSMIFIDHLSDIVAHLVEKKLSGVFLVKNPEDVNTKNIVFIIGKYYGNRIYKSSLFGFILKLFGNRSTTLRKVFGNLTYKDEDCIIREFSFTPISTQETIIKSQE